MNLFLVKADGTLVTPEINGSILEGVTRDSLITLAKARGLTVEERPVTVDEWREGVADGSIVEAFACGTAAVITPIAELKSAEFTLTMPEVEDRLAMSLRQELTDIQYGRIPDVHGWLVRLDAAAPAEAPAGA